MNNSLKPRKSHFTKLYSQNEMFINYLATSRAIYVICRLGPVRIVKTCDLGYGMLPKAL